MLNYKKRPPGILVFFFSLASCQSRSSWKYKQAFLSVQKRKEVFGSSPAMRSYPLTLDRPAPPCVEPWIPLS